MPEYKIKGTFYLTVHAEDEENAIDQLGKLIDSADEHDMRFDYEVDEVEEQEEHERCDKCSKKVSSTELEQNNGTCYVCAHPDEVTDTGE